MTSKTDNNPSGGTVRLDAMAATDTGAGGTVRIDAAASANMGAGGTVRVNITSTPVVTAGGDSGTARIDTAGAVSVAAPVGVATSAQQERLLVGQTIVLNGCSYRVASELSAVGSEANTYVVDGAEGSVVLKRYRQGVRMPAPVLQRVNQLGHRNVVKVHDLGTVDGHDLEMLEFIAGGSLAERLRRQGPIKDVALLRKLVQGIVDGLDHLHHVVGLIYQDLKPDNVLLADDVMDRVVLADFGISTLRKGQEERVKVVANGTREYAAPELARFGNDMDVEVTEKVDYFALGVTLMECWTGERPFRNDTQSSRRDQLDRQTVPFPTDMAPTLKQLIQGLIKYSAADRFGVAEVRRWIAGDALAVDYSVTGMRYPKLDFGDGRWFSNPIELAKLMAQDPKQGETYLYMGMVQEWLDKAGDMRLSAAVRKIVADYDRDKSARQAGLTKAVYTLDIDEPFITAAGRVCNSGEEIGDALLAEKDHYLTALGDPNEAFYLYFSANDEEEFASETLALFVGSKAREHGFYKTVYTLQGGGEARVKIQGSFFYHPDEFQGARAEVRQLLIDELHLDHSRVLIWLRQLACVEKTLGLGSAEGVDLLGIFKAFPWLELRSLLPAFSTQREAKVATALVRRNRMDLADVFLRQKLSLNVVDDDVTPLCLAAAWGRKDVAEQLLALGADPNCAPPDGRNPLCFAIMYRESALVDLLLAHGANPNHTLADGTTLLALAASESRFNNVDHPIAPAIVESLLTGGAQVDQTSGAGERPLHLILTRARTDDALRLLEACLKAGASIKATGPNQHDPAKPPYTALFCALHSYRFDRQRAANYLSVIERLLEAGASLSEAYADMAPLHFAAATDDEPLAQLLLKRGASRYQVCGDAMLPVTYAVNAANAGKAGVTSTLDKLLKPGFVLGLSAGFHKLLRFVARVVVLFLLVLLLVPIGARVMSGWMFGRDPVSLVVTYGWVLGVVLAWQLVAATTPALALQQWGQNLKSFGGWFRNLLLLPALVAGASAGVAQLWQAAYRIYPLAVSQPIRSGLPILMSLAVTMTLAVLYSKVTDGKRRAMEKLSQARQRKVVAGRSVGGRLFGFAVHLASALIVLVHLSFYLSSGLLGFSWLPVPADRWAEAPFRAVLSMGELKQVVRNPVISSTAVLNSKFVLKISASVPRCELPPGTELTDVRQIEPENGVERYLVGLAEAENPCHTGWRQSYMAVPKEKVTLTGTSPGAETGKPRTKVRNKGVSPNGL